MTGGTESGEYQTLRDAGIPVVANAEWLENDPLGRAEWVKCLRLPRRDPPGPRWRRPARPTTHGGRRPDPAAPGRHRRPRRRGARRRRAADADPVPQPARRPLLPRRQLRRHRRRARAGCGAVPGELGPLGRHPPGHRRHPRQRGELARQPAADLDGATARHPVLDLVAGQLLRHIHRRPDRPRPRRRRRAAGRACLGQAAQRAAARRKLRPHARPAPAPTPRPCRHPARRIPARRGGHRLLRPGRLPRHRRPAHHPPPARHRRPPRPRPRHWAGTAASACGSSSACCSSPLPA